MYAYRLHAPDESRIGRDCKTELEEGRFNCAFSTGGDIEERRVRYDIEESSRGRGVNIPPSPLSGRGVKKPLSALEYMF
jgi:hypothetical protein